MSQMAGGGVPAMPTDTSVGYSPQGPIGQEVGPSSGGTPLGEGPAGGGPPGVAGLSKMQKFAEFLGSTPEEREKNAKAFAAMVKDIGNIGRTMSESSLMQRMMSEQMGGAAYIGEGTSPSGGIAAIPRTFDPSQAQGIMAQLGFK